MIITLVSHQIVHVSHGYQNSEFLVQTLSPNNRGRLFLGRGVLTGLVKEPVLEAWFRSPGGVVVSPDGTCVYSVLSGASAFDQGTQPELLLFSESSSLRWLLNSVTRPAAPALCFSCIHLPCCPCPYPITPPPPPFAFFGLKRVFVGTVYMVGLEVH